MAVCLCCFWPRPDPKINWGGDKKSLVWEYPSSASAQPGRRWLWLVYCGDSEDIFHPGPVSSLIRLWSRQPLVPVRSRGPQTSELLLNLNSGKNQSLETAMTSPERVQWLRRWQGLHVIWILENMQVVSVLISIVQCRYRDLREL